MTSSPARSGAPRPARRRTPLAVAALAVLVTGLAVSQGDDIAADLAGGALYAALVHLLALLVAPCARAATAAASALAVCVAVELAQLTPVPAAAVAAWPPAAYVLGSTFVAWDLLAYAAGVLVVATVDVLRRRTRQGRRPLARVLAGGRDRTHPSA
ncbi:DUF2809 domain-containing protein [Cellulomonas sp. S1-8]|uniref:DUF2809 domain-containing protein n=1 Tax=Cellulomonas sp. S1-8 TaxID=2904790 RepID=UPI0022435618|nr:DUF2809 domain-containing protein [Cellulomonas sp. S1-8]UZN05149.1 DUF2809 domain-containing protein [Cellulomonas sp. S1-8]